MDNKPNGASVAQRLIAQVIATIWSEFYSFTGSTLNRQLPKYICSFVIGYSFTDASTDVTGLIHAPLVYF
jgi:hypothetical protein